MRTDGTTSFTWLCRRDPWQGCLLAHVVCNRCWPPMGALVCMPHTACTTWRASRHQTVPHRSAGEHTPSHHFSCLESSSCDMCSGMSTNVRQVLPLQNLDQLPMRPHTALAAGRTAALLWLCCNPAHIPAVLRAGAYGLEPSSQLEPCNQAVPATAPVASTPCNRDIFVLS